MALPISNIVTNLTDSPMIGKGVGFVGNIASSVGSNMIAGAVMGGGGGGQGPGWHNQSYRHALAARGVKTTYNMGSHGVRQTPDILVKQEIVASTKIPEGWKLVRFGYTGDKLQNDQCLFEIWSTTFEKEKNHDEAKYYYIIRAISKGNDRFGDPIVVNRFDNYNYAVQWLIGSKSGKFTQEERP